MTEESTKSTPLLNNPPPADAQEQPASEQAKGEENEETDRPVLTGGLSIRENSKGWKFVSKNLHKINVVKQAVGKVKLENKIGTSATELKEDDPLKTISLATQRAIQQLGSREDTTKGKLHRTVKFEADDSSFAATRQPAFECTELHGEHFKEVRQAFGIPETRFYAVLGLQARASSSSFNVIGSAEASGKSPSFFLCSPDQRYILKSCTPQDVETLCRILPSYRDHVQSCCTEKEGNASLLPRYIGLYEFKFQDKHPIRRAPNCTLLVMTNFFAGTYTIHKKFDLKGSTFHREASQKERAKSTPIFKDLDWIHEGHKLAMESKADYHSIRERLRRDTWYLRQQELMDYSLLVGVHEMDKRSSHNSASVKPRDEIMGVLTTQTEKEIYYYGLVDILTPYTWKKRLETLLGSCMCHWGISCQPPNLYQQRFMSFLDDEILECTDEK